MCSGVASGWHGWTMSRGPRAKGAPSGSEKKEKTKKKKRKSRGRGPGEFVVHGPHTFSLRHWLCVGMRCMHQCVKLFSNTFVISFFVVVVFVVVVVFFLFFSQHVDVAVTGASAIKKASKLAEKKNYKAARSHL